MNLGIDFGTTNSTIAWYNPATFRQETVEIGGQARIPSLVCWASERADRLFGAEARAEAANAENWETEARLQFRDRLASSFKTDFAAGHASVSSLNLGTNVSPDSVVEAYLAWLLAQFREATGTAETEPIRATFTHPATQEWTQSGPQSPCARLERIARKAGFGTVRLELEPIAAFREAERRGIDLGKGVLVFDLGGGTLDLVYFRRDDDESWGAPFLAGTGCAGIAGDTFDEVAMQWLGHRVENATDNAVSLRDVVAARQRAREGKEGLSSRSSVDVPWIARTEGSAMSGKETFRRETFENEAESTFERIRRELRAYVEAIRARNAPIDAVLLVGGSTNIPKVQAIVQAETGARCIRPDDADFLVALGAVELEPWAVGAHMPAHPHLIAGDERGQWRADPGYEVVWRKDGTPMVRWKPGSLHPGDSHLLAGPEPDEWRSTAGYKVVCRTNGRLTTRWTPGMVHPTACHIVAATERDMWIPSNGFIWADGTRHATSRPQVVKTIDSWPHIVKCGDGKWRPAEGYDWDKVSDMESFRVHWSPGKRNLRSHMRASFREGYMEPDPFRSQQEILDAFHGLSHYRSYLGDRIPENKLYNARLTMDVPMGETVVLLFDDTVFRGSREGFLVTTGGVYAKDVWLNVHVDWNSLQAVKVFSQYLQLDETSVNLHYLIEDELIETLQTGFESLLMHSPA